MRNPVAGLRAFYGARPLHLLAVIASFALAGYAVLLVSDDPGFPAMAVWFGGALIAHDLLLFPLYALADRSLRGGLRRAHRGRTAIAALNHIRIPALAGALLLLLYFPGILELGSVTFTAATGQTQDPFLARWLLVVAVLFGTSALLYAVRLAHATRTGAERAEDRGSTPPPRDERPRPDGV